MENLVFSLNATMPIFILMVLGYVLKLIGWMDEAFATKLNSFVFKVALPLLVFEDLATVDFREAWNGKFVLFCFVATVISILISFLLSLLLKNKGEQGEFIQASYRSSAAILGLAFIQNIYGSAGLGPLMIIGSVPLYNICAVVVLSVFSPENRGKKIDGELLKKTLLGIIKNPIILGIIVGLLWSALSVPIPKILLSTVSKVGGMSTPLGLIAMGACFDFKKALASGKAASLASFIKLVGYGLIFVPIAISMGYREQELVAILVMLCSATTISCYVMAKNMGHEGTLTSATVMLTTLLAAFTLTGWLYILKTIGVI